MPPEANRTGSGRFFASASRSFIVFSGEFGLVTTTKGSFAISPIGTRSLRQSNGMFARSAGLITMVVGAASSM